MDNRILSEEQFQEIEKTEILSPKQVKALDDYIEYITSLEEKYNTDLPLDIDLSLTADLERITDILSRHLNKKGIYPEKYLDFEN